MPDVKSIGTILAAASTLLLAASTLPAQNTADIAAVRQQADRWRAEHRLIDMHQHIEFTPERLARAVRIMDGAGIGIAVSLGSGTVTRGENGEPSEFERAKRVTDELYPGRFIHYMLLDYKHWNDDDFAEQAAAQIEEGHRLGAAGLKEFKRLGLFLRDKHGNLISPDDPKLDHAWAKCGELGMPVSIHVGDPKAFWEPFDETNERWAELKDHRNWWFGDSAKYPPRMEIVEAMNRVIAKHPETTFVGVHFANNAEDLAWVDASLSKHPNMMADVAARVPEIGRHDPAAVRELFIKHQDRILFGTDFQVYSRLILGSSGNEPPSSDFDALTFFDKHWRWFETRDRDWPHMTPIQGDWTISSIGLPAEVLRKIYFDNARKLLARSLPNPTLKAARTSDSITLDGVLDEKAWQDAQVQTIEYTLADGTPRPELSTEVRSLWSDDALYFSFVCPFTKLTVFETPVEGERLGLWDRDVVEVFVETDPAKSTRYAEYEVAPTGEQLDVLVDLPEKDFAWLSGVQSAVKVDNDAHRWTAEIRIPTQNLLSAPLAKGTRLRMNLFRSDRADDAFLAWNPTLKNTTHVPERFGVLELE
jgi:predicted TIM-barrel fold metal-dependent hydrolase